TLAEQATGFANPDEAARLLADWVWQDNAFKVFQSTALTPAGAPIATIDISLTRFASTEGAATALPYFLQDRVASLGQREVQTLNQNQTQNQQPVGDEMRMVTGDVEGGADTTLYVRSGPLLTRISATARAGALHAAPEQIALGIIQRAAGQSPPVTAGPQAEFVLFSSETLPLDNAACFRVAGEGALDMETVAERLATGPDLAAALEELGWAGGAFRQFTCDPPAGRAGWIDLSVHRFRDPAAAAEAVSMFADTRARGMDLQPVKVIPLGANDAALAGPAVNGAEYTRYVSSGPLLFAITGVAPVGDPRSDVEQIAAALVALPGQGQGTAPGPVAAVPTATPYALDAAPTVAPLPTATPLPLPTATPAPTPTFVPAPTAIPIPTAIPTEPPPPTMISVAIAPAAPTAVPAKPTATTGPLPSPTPRVIHLPTPDAD
ncbi:MAG: hypothetical protein H0V00_16375, partial [Chloroflexia bacterium]|nr:hypothetical protein [Chloroflexia bacterium]